jgi:hypothetical protein
MGDGLTLRLVNERKLDAVRTMIAVDYSDTTLAIVGFDSGMVFVIWYSVIQYVCDGYA